MSGAMHGGDEVGALVFDFGAHSLRGGFAGEDSPKIDIPSCVGLIDEDVDSMKSRRYVVGHSITVPRAGMELQPLLKDGMIEDWDLFEKVVDHMFRCLAPGASLYHPVLFSEPPWNSKGKREKIAEIMFEKFQVPAIYLAKNAVLTCFANGRYTGLVLDSGATHTVAIPVLDGTVISQGIVRSPLAGDFIVRQCQKLLVDEQNVDLVPSYRVLSKDPVKEREAAKWRERPGLPAVTDSYRKFMSKGLLQDFSASTIQIADDRYDQNQVDTFPMISYELPNGFNLELGHERFQLPEALFDPSIIVESGGNSMLSMSHVVTSSVSMCDIDVRANLYGNIIVVGGNSLIMGFTERLQRDLNIKTPSTMRLKVNYAVSSSERRFSSWIGGSILGSLGTFQQMWVSKQEYQDMGKSCVEKKCI